MSKTQKILIIAGIALDVALTVGLFVISIIMIATMPHTKEQAEALTGFIGFLQAHPTIYFWACVVPLFVLLAGNIVLLFLYVKKTAPKKDKVELNELSEEQKEALRKELLKDINSNDSDE